MDIVPQSALADRLETLTRVMASGLPDETVFDATLRIAAALAGVQQAVICLDAGHCHWVRSEFGPALRQAVQASGLHAASLREAGTLIVPDAAEAPGFQDDDLVTGPWLIRFYASLPLRLPRHGPVGTLCLLDPAPRQLTETQIATLQDLARTIADQIALRLHATTDSLTGVYTRRYIGCYLEPEISRCRRHGNPLSAMAIDLDGLTSINASLGHAAGDIWIQTVVTAIRASLRFCDLVARVGGKTFLVILPETPAQGAELVAERTRGAIAALRLPFADTVITGTASLGVTTMTSHDHHVGDLLHRLDAALGKAGPNHVIFKA
jgi:diguanylate cyclase (GGDEF)-like protein